MEALLAQFSLLADDALSGGDFDPTKMDALMELFEQEAYATWTSAAAEHRDAQRAAEQSAREAEDYFDSIMEASMAEFRRACDEADKEASKELSGLLRAADTAKEGGDAFGAAATAASKRYVEAAVASATATMKSAFARSKVHPSSVQ